MNEKTLSKLEYNKILAQLAEHTRFPVSRDQALNLRPTHESYEAMRLLAETDEARELLRLNPLFSLGGLWDIRPALHHAEIGGVLSPEELVHVAALCRSARTTKGFFSDLKGNFPVLTGWGRSLVFVRTVESAVDKAISPDLSINDKHPSVWRAFAVKRRSAPSRYVFVWIV